MSCDGGGGWWVVGDGVEGVEGGGGSGGVGGIEGMGCMERGGGVRWDGWDGVGSDGDIIMTYGLGNGMDSSCVTLCKTGFLFFYRYT